MLHNAIEYFLVLQKVLLIIKGECFFKDPLRELFFVEPNTVTVYHRCEELFEHLYFCVGSKVPPSFFVYITFYLIYCINTISTIAFIKITKWEPICAHPHFGFILLVGWYLFYKIMCRMTWGSSVNMVSFVFSLCFIQTMEEIWFELKGLYMNKYV